MNAFLWLASGYLAGLIVPGYMTLWFWMKARKVEGEWPSWLTNILIGVHFVLGMSGFFAAARVGHLFRDAGSVLEAVLFGVAGLASIFVGLFIGRDWDRRLGNHSP
jgi:hypothetical protein